MTSRATPPSRRSLPTPSGTAPRPKPGTVLGERQLIAKLRKSAARVSPAVYRARTRIALGIGDDCAILRPRSGEEIVLTTDLFLENVHFRRSWDLPEAAGHRCLARGLSDVAAMGATPLAAFLSLALPPELAGTWSGRFLNGLLRLATRHEVMLAGGDTAQAPQTGAGALVAADVVLVGTLPRGKALLRSGARPGDGIYVTGALGGSAAELAQLTRSPAAFAQLRRARAGHPHLFPEPRLAAGHALLGRASAAIDLSDGLSNDLAHLCQESGVAAEIDLALLPIHPLALKTSPQSHLELALHGGEDYELLFTAAPGRRMRAALGGTPVHRIGRILPSAPGRPRVTQVSADGLRKPLRNLGWQHLDFKHRKASP